jgi:NADPH-dependent curcumin reductase CurA
VLVVKRLRLEGFVVMDYYDRRTVGEERLATWITEGRLKVGGDILEGLERAPEALIGLLRGDNTGKRRVRVAADAV